MDGATAACSNDAANRIASTMRMGLARARVMITAADELGPAIHEAWHEVADGIQAPMETRRRRRQAIGTSTTSQTGNSLPAAPPCSHAPSNRRPMAVVVRVGARPFHRRLDARVASGHDDGADARFRHQREPARKFLGRLLLRLRPDADSHRCLRGHLAREAAPPIAGGARHADSARRATCRMSIGRAIGVATASLVITWAGDPLVSWAASPCSRVLG